MPDILAGVEGSLQDRRLRALKAHRRALEEAPTEDEVRRKESLFKAILPLILAQGVDLLTTESPTGFLSVPGTKEMNPLPGMQGTAGRLGWQGIQAALVALAMKKNPTLGRIYRNAAVGAHTAAARGNQALTDRQTARVGGAPYFVEQP